MASVAEPHDDAKIDSQQRLDHAIVAGDVAQILHLLDDTSLDLDRKDLGHDLATPLMRMSHMRASSEELDVVLEKLERCAWNPNVQDAMGRTLLMHACIADRCSLALLCLDNGCDVSLTDKDGNSALVYAVRQGSEEIVRVFLDLEECRSLLLTQANNFGQTPRDVAVQDGHDALADLLASYLPSEHDPSKIPLALPSTTSALSSNSLLQPSPLTPRTPANGTCRQDDHHLRRTTSEIGRGLELHVLLNSYKGSGGGEGEGGYYHQQLSCRQSELVSSKVSSRLSTASSTPHHSHYHNHLHPAHRHHDLENTPPDPFSHAMTSREMSSCSDVMRHVHLPATSREATTCSELGEKSPRRAKRKKQQRLLRRETEDLSVAEGHPEDVTRGGKPCSKEFQRCKKDYMSLPDLRDLKGKLVTSGEVTPVSSDGAASLTSQKSSGTRTEREHEENETPSQSYLERYKDGDLSASCSLPPLQSSSADSADRRKDRGGKLVHRGKASSQEEVMLRSLIV